MLPPARKLDFTDVPVIDLGPAWSGGASGRSAVADVIADACGRVGFFYVRNHGLTDADIAAIFQTSADFHNLLPEAKMEVSMTKNNHAQGYLHGMTKATRRISPRICRRLSRSSGRLPTTIRTFWPASRCTERFCGRAP